MSQWHEEHEYLIAVVAWGKPERTGPAASHCPPEPGIEVLQPGPPADGKAKLLESHLCSRYLPGVHHQGTSDPLAACRRKALEMTNGAPVSNNRARIAVQVHPADQATAGLGDEEPAAVRAEAGEELVSDRCDVGSADGKKWEPDRPAGVADQDPAVNEFPPQARGDLLWLVSWLSSGSVGSRTAEVCQAAAECRRAGNRWCCSLG